MSCSVLDFVVVVLVQSFIFYYFLTNTLATQSPNKCSFKANGVCLPI